MLGNNYKYKRKDLDCLAWQLTLDNINKEWPDFIKNLVNEKKIRIWAYDDRSKVNGTIIASKQFVNPGDYIVLDYINGEEYISVYPEKKFNDFFELCINDYIEVIGGITDFNLEIFFDKDLADENSPLARKFYNVFNDAYKVVDTISNYDTKVTIVIKDLNGNHLTINSGDTVILLSNNRFAVVPRDVKHVYDIKDI